jgi:hypothetical protein
LVVCDWTLLQHFSIFNCVTFVHSIISMMEFFVPFWNLMIKENTFDLLHLILMFMIVIKVAGWLVSAMVVDGMFIKLTKVQYWFLIMTHGKTIVVNMILQMFCNYNIHGIVIKKIDQKTIIEMPSSFHPYWITNNVFIVMCITFT